MLGEWIYRNNNKHLFSLFSLIRNRTRSTEDKNTFEHYSKIWSAAIHTENKV